ncbi:hypothetical protein [Streptomyces sp. NBC_01216]|uniref:hypothetical protein n=1 Tax=Streptomyces sp. NBC_01216 TaxID=2903778 RepID=UPI002E113AC4
MSSSTLDAPALERLVATAVAAPSLPDTQPWRFRVDTDTRTVRIPVRAFETRPTLALLSTAHDRRTDRLRTGQALERVPLPAPRVRAQMVIRVGHGPEAPASPRRPMEKAMDGDV